MPRTALVGTSWARRTAAAIAISTADRRAAAAAASEAASGSRALATPSAVVFEEQDDGSSESDDSCADGNDHDGAGNGGGSDDDSESFVDTLTRRRTSVAAPVPAAKAAQLPIATLGAPAPPVSPAPRGKSILAIFRAECRAGPDTVKLTNPQIKALLNGLDGAER
jgi:hypothetical protein